MLKNNKEKKITDYNESQAKQVFAFLLGVIFMWITLIGFGGIIPRESYEEYRNIDRMKNTILSKFYKIVDEDALYGGMKKGLFAVLEDKYSYYLSPEELKALLDSSEGVFYGYGLGSIQYSENYIWIGYVMDNSPAKAVGILSGDKIISIDGLTIEEIGIEKSKEILLDNDRDGINIEILRDEKYNLNFFMKKEKIEEKSVFEELKEDILYIKINQFINTTQDEFKEALNSNKNSKALIIDLRNNGGGLLDSVLEVADQILGEGLITYTETKEGNKEEYSASNKNILEMPIILLVNKNSASASELLTAALKENNVAQIYGETTFGKGIVQGTYRLPDGSGFKLTNRKYFTPLGNDIHEVGVNPDVFIEQDIKIELGSEEDLQLKKALEDIAKLIN